MHKLTNVGCVLMKKILAFSSIRSDYDLLSPLYKLLHNDPEIDFKILVSGAHLSHQYGYSVEQIREDGIDILLEIETLLSSDTALSRVKSASLLLQNSLETIAKFNPDLMIYAGDREDVLMYAMIGGYLSIPTIHFSAGDHVQDGYIDNPVRHATSKLSTAHFVDLEIHKKRLIAMGEDKSRIFVVGAISLDNFVQFQPLNRDAVFKKLSLKEKKTYAILIFHSITEEKNYTDKIFENILKILSDKNIFTFVGYPNVDPGSSKLLSIIDKFSKHKNFYFYKNLSRELFLSLYKHADFIIGNSSSGVCEAASIPIPAINVGMRQVGRLTGDNVVFCDSDYKSIKKAVDFVMTPEFKNKIKSIVNPYGDGDSALKAYRLIKTVDFKSMLAKKEDPLEVSNG